MDDAPTTRSKMVAASVGAVGTNERARGWSSEMQAGASWSIHRRRAAGPPMPSGVMVAPIGGRQVGRRAGRVERRRIHAHALEGVVDHLPGPASSVVAV